MAIDKSEMTPRSFSLYRDSSDEIARIGRALSIPDRVVCIGDYAFYGTGIEEAVFGKGAVKPMFIRPEGAVKL